MTSTVGWVGRLLCLINSREATTSLLPGLCTTSLLPGLCMCNLNLSQFEIERKKLGLKKGPEDTFTVQYVYHYKFVFYFFNPLGRIFRGCLVFAQCSRNVAVQPAD